MIGIHSVHRRLAELTLKARRLGGYDRLSTFEQVDLRHCLEFNADLVQRLDGLKELAFIAHTLGEMEWQQDLCKQIDDLETRLV